MIFPDHKISLSLEHNEHKSYYQTLKEWEANFVECPLGWISDEQRQKAIERDNVWVLQWYPDTPVGFIRIAACDLELLMEAASSGEHQKNLRA